ncbi:MAG: hypothetical protein PHY73_05780 [Candidatus Omnitrophica bacterium]|nr:hypothetical protein [Candidatus Omnitrophota bacterium]
MNFNAEGQKKIFGAPRGLCFDQGILNHLFNDSSRRTKSFFSRQSARPWFKIVCVLVLFFFFDSCLLPDIVRVSKAYANPQVSVPASNLLMPSFPFSRPSLRAIQINPENPFEIDFLIDTEDKRAVREREAKSLVEYFLAVLTIPEKDLWVNLSPYEEDRIIPEPLSQTRVGNDLLAQDQLLKQLTASLTYPEKDLGKVFWERLYSKVYEKYQTTDIPVNTFNKVWIVPDRAVVYEFNNTAFIADSHLKVMLEQDYLSLNKNREIEVHNIGNEKYEEISSISSQIAKEVILPEIEKEINEGRHFAPLRQIYHSLILAIWFKQKLRKSLLNQIYADQSKIKGIDSIGKEAHKEIYNQYLEFFKQGAYNYIRIEKDKNLGRYIPRQYFSGGFDIGQTRRWLKTISITAPSIVSLIEKLNGVLTYLKVKLNPLMPSFKNAAEHHSLDAKPIIEIENSVPVSVKAASPVAVTQKIFPSSFSQVWKRGTFFLMIMFLPFFSAPLGLVTDQNEKAKIEVVDETKTLKLGDKLSVEDQQIIKAIKETITLEDIESLDGKTNPQTGQKYKIDKEYFRRNFNKNLKVNTYAWDSQTMVIAYQLKHGLFQDGVIGPEVKKSIFSKNIISSDGPDPEDEIQGSSVSNGASSGHHLASEPVSQNTIESIDLKQDIAVSVQDTARTEEPSSGSSQQAKEKSSWRDQLSNFINWFIIIFSAGLHSTVVFGRKELKVKHSFLKFFNQYLKGGDRHPFKSVNRTSVIPFLSRCLDILARQVYDEIDVTIKMSDRVSKKYNKNDLLAKAILDLIKNNDLVVFSNSERPIQLEYKSSEIEGRNIHLHFQIPKEAPNCVRKGDIVNLKYRNRSGKISTVSIPLVHSATDELSIYWGNLLDKKTELSKSQIETLIKKVHRFEKTSEADLSHFNRDMIAAYNDIRDLSIRTAQVLKQQDNAQNELEYFISLARRSNRFRFLMGLSSIMYRLRIWFLPREDSLNRRLGHFRIDKLARIGSGTEYCLNRMRNLAMPMISEFSFFKKQTQDFVDQNIVEKKIEQQESLVAENTRNWLSHIFSRENPKNHSIVGRDLVRRHQKIVEFLLVLVAGFSLLTGLGTIKWGLAFWAFLRFVVFYAWLPWHIEKKVKKEFNFYENQINQIDEDFQRDDFLNSSQYISFLETDEKQKSQKQKFLDFLGSHILNNIKPSRFILRAKKFFDVTAVARPKEVELSLKLETHLNRKSKVSKEARQALEKSIKQGAIRFSFSDGSMILPENINVSVISSRFFVKIKRPFNGSQTEKLEIYFSGEEKPAVIDIEKDIARNFINIWQKYLDSEDFKNFEVLNSIISFSRAFRRDGEFEFEKFRENAKLSRKISRLALETWEKIKDIEGMPSKYVEYFWLLKFYENDVRNSMGEFSTADTYKGFFYEDSHAYGHRYRFSPATALRNVFAFWFYYTWARYNLLKSIKKHENATKDLGQIEEEILNLPKLKQASKKKRMFNNVQRIFFSYQFPKENSIIAGELYGRMERMWQMMANIALMTIAFFVPYFEFITQTIPIDRIFVVLVAIVYWVMPLQAHNQLRRDYLNFIKEASLKARTKAKHSAANIWHNIRTIFWRMNNVYFYMFYFLGLIYDARIIFGLFIYLQIESLLTRPKNGFNGNGYSNVLDASQALDKTTFDFSQKENVVDLKPQGQPSKSSSNIQSKPLSQKGGIDLNKASFQVEIIEGPDYLRPAVPMINFPLNNFQGFDFKILQFMPIVNPAAYLQNMFCTSEKLSYQTSN